MTTISVQTRSQSRFLSRITTVPAALTAIVAVSAIASFVAAIPRATVAYLPDEYLYAQLARSLGHGQGSTVLGQTAALPAMLEPLLTAGFWSLSDATVSLHLTQAFHSVVMSLAAVPTYLIARELKISTRAALACAIVSVVSPALVYTSYVTADSLGYLLALVAIHAAIRMCARPTILGQVWFLAAAGLATFTRLQYAALIPATLVAIVVVERLNPVRAVRRFGVVAMVVGLGLVAMVASGGSVLGRYEAVTGFGVSGRTLDWIFRTGALALVATGAAIAPGAIAWACSTVVRPGDRARSAYATLSLVGVGALVVAAAMVSADTHSDRFLERYLIVAYPLVAIGFFCWIDEGRPARAVAIATAAGVIVIAARVPVTGDLFGQGAADSPTLNALSRLGGMIGLVEASLVAALVVSVLAGLAIWAALTPRLPGPPLVLVSMAVLGITLVGAHWADLRGSERAYSNAFGESATWVEAAKPGPTLLVQTPDSNPYISMVTAFWNPTIVRAEPFGRERISTLDGLGKAPVSAGQDGVLRDPAGRAVDQAVLFALGGSEAVFSRSNEVLRDRFFALVRPHGSTPRLQAFAAGVRSNNTVAPVGWFTAYAPATGGCTRASLALTLPPTFPSTVLEFQDSTGRRFTRAVRGGEVTTVSVVSTAKRSRTLRFKAIRIGGLRDGSTMKLTNSQIVTNVSNGTLSAQRVSCPIES